MMMNYISFRLAEYMVSGPLRDPAAGIVQTKSVSLEAELWTLYSIPTRLQDPLNALAAALAGAAVVVILMRWLFGLRLKARFPETARRRLVYLGSGLLAGIDLLYSPASPHQIMVAFHRSGGPHAHRLVPGDCHGSTGLVAAAAHHAWF